MSLLALTAMAVSSDGFASDFDDIVAALLNSDRELALARQQATAEGDMLNADNVLTDPEAEFEFLDSRSGEKKYNLTVSQSFDWPGVYGARSRQISLQRTSLELNNDMERNDRRHMLRTLLVDIIATNLTIDRLTSAVEGCDKLLAVMEADYKKGNISVLSVNKVRVELADFRLQLSEALNKKDLLTGELTAAVDDVSAALERCEGLKNFPLLELRPLPEYTEKARQNAPGLLWARNQTLVAEARRDVASKSVLPGFSAGYRLSREDGILFNGFVVGVNLPVWRASKERKAAASEVVSAKLGEEFETIKLEKSIEATYRNACNIKETLSQYGEALAAADNIQLLKKAYDAGAITLTEFVLDINFFVEAATRHIELQRQYYNALLQLTRYDDITS